MIQDVQHRGLPDGLLLRVTLNMLARTVLSRWGLPMALTQHTRRLHWSAAALCVAGVGLQHRKMLLTVAAEGCEHLTVLNYRFFKNSYTGASLSYVFYRHNKDICVLKMAPANTSYGKGSFTLYSWQAFLCRDPLRLCESSI